MLANINPSTSAQRMPAALASAGEGRQGRVAPSSSKRKARKRRRADRGGRTGPLAPKASSRAAAGPGHGASDRGGPAAPGLLERARARAAAQASYQPRAQGFASTLKRQGERPRGPFGGVPVSEFAIFAGIVAAVYGFLSGALAPLIAGLAICALGVLELTAREHFSGFRSHTTLLAAVPAVLVEAGLALGVGEPREHILILVPVAPVFALSFWRLRRRFLAARQRRLAARG
jgi:hypothetical protein